MSDARSHGAGGHEPTAWIDNHCHLGGDSGARTWGSVDLVLADGRSSGVVGFVDVAVDLHSAVGCLATAAEHPDVWATAGVHPHSATDGIDGLDELLGESTGRGGLVAVGECGLDFHYDHSPRAVQREVFAKQVRLANEYGLPLVIHSRDAWDDTFAVLDAEGVPERTVFHCFTGGSDEAGEVLTRGGYVSVSGIVTFGSANALADAVAEVPLNRLMVETDSPYLAPVPHRGEPNRPALVGRVGARVAQLKGLSVAEVSAATVATTRRFYGLDGGGSSPDVPVDDVAGA